MDRLGAGGRLFEHAGIEKIPGDTADTRLRRHRGPAQRGDGVPVGEGALDDRAADLSFSDDEVMHEDLQDVSTALYVVSSVNTALGFESRAPLS